MEIIILRDQKIYARARADDDDTGVFTVMTVLDKDIPTYPTTKADVGKTYELSLDVKGLKWIEVERPTSLEERVKTLEEKVLQKYSSEKEN